MEDREKRIKELEAQISDFNKKIEITRNRFEKSKQRYNRIIEKLTDDFFPINDEYNKLIVEHWIERGKRGLNKGLNVEQIPVQVKKIFYDITDNVKGGCSGDWYDGCRGCDRNCELEAEKKYKEMFGF